MLVVVGRITEDGREVSKNYRREVMTRLQS